MLDPLEKTDFDNPPGIFFPHVKAQQFFFEGKLKHNSCVYDD
jgi:hypothetical protein